MVLTRWSSCEKGIFLTQLYRLGNKQEDYDKKMKISALRRWIDCTIEQRHRSVEVDSRLRLIEILKTSTKNDRTEFHKMEIRKYIVANLNCIPKTISNSELDMLCNEIDYVPTLGISVLFLQDVYDNVYYMRE